MKISSHFDGGSIDVVSTDNHKAVLKIRKDSHSDFLQWFYFQVHVVDQETHEFEIINAGKTSYTDGWEGYNPCVSYDRETWYRVPGSYDGKTLKFEVLPDASCFYVAYFAPYSYERHLDLISSAQISPVCGVIPVCSTVDGRDLSVLQIGEGEKVYWMTARQHPGETMAEWFVEGFLERLLDEDDPVAQRLLKEVTFYIVPNMNPDGAARGNLRTNAAGANLNREWLEPSIENSPEVYYVREMMHETGVDMYLDVHGDEALPYNFVAGNEGNPSYDDRLRKLEDQFKETLLSVGCEFQTKHGYDLDAPGTGDLSKATNYVGETFDCLAYTLEMPFKDNADLPDPIQGWSPERSKQLARDVLTTMAKML